MALGGAGVSNFTYTSGGTAIGVCAPPGVSGGGVSAYTPSGLSLVWENDPVQWEFEPVLWQDTQTLFQAYPGAAAAYSLRDLTGEEPTVVRVRRSDNNAEQNFTAAQITDGTLVAFVGAGNDGLVTTWYDQSGNDNHVTQATAGNQPKIVDSGALVLENGKAALDFDGSDDVFDVSAIMANQVANSTDKAIVVVSKSDGVGVAARRRQLFFGNGVSTRVTTFAETDTEVRFSANLFGNTINATGFDNTVQFLLYGDDVSGDQSLYLNGNLEGSNALGGTNNDVTVAEISSATSSQYWDGTIQEIIIYPSDQSANRVGIETNINDHYEIFP